MYLLKGEHTPILVWVSNIRMTLKRSVSFEITAYSWNLISCNKQTKTLFGFKKDLICFVLFCFSFSWSSSMCILISLSIPPPHHGFPPYYDNCIVLQQSCNSIVLQKYSPVLKVTFGAGRMASQANPLMYSTCWYSTCPQFLSGYCTSHLALW